MRDHVRLTTQPFDGPPAQADLEQLLEQIGSDRMLLFSSDYPHWQFDGDSPIPPGFPASLVARMCHDNPLETFPRLQASA
jgi:predicted TIM-barrel fold metal-dependent hydrolase